MSRELGVQFAREGIRVNALCPGPINTPLLQELFAKDPERAARRLVHVPMGRFGEAEEIAAPCRSWPATTRRSSPPPRSWSTAASAAPTSPRSEAVPAQRPVIGLSTYREHAQFGVWHTTADVLHAQYADAILAAGGIPVLLPPASGSAEVAHEVVGRLDGLW